MKKLALACLLSVVVTFLPQSVSAVPTITLVSQPDTIDGLSSVFVDVVVSGLDTLLGAWELDLLYDPTVFVPQLVPPSGFGGLLGDVFAGEAVGGADVSVAGVISFLQVSLLSSGELDALQGNPPGSGNVLDELRLATIGLFRFDPSTGVPVSLLDSANVILSDDLGNRILPVANPTTGVFIGVPEPGSWALLVAGALLLGRRRLRHEQDRSETASRR